MIPFLKALVSVLFLWMCYVVISTSISDNLFQEWNSLGSILWMRATLWDFYTNVAIILLWIFYKEKKILYKIIWFILLVTLGSIASCSYLLIQLFKLKPSESVKDLLINQNG